MKKTRLKWPKPDKKPRGGDKKSTAGEPKEPDTDGGGKWPNYPNSDKIV